MQSTFTSRIIGTPHGVWSKVKSPGFKGCYCIMCVIAVSHLPLVISSGLRAYYSLMTYSAVINGIYLTVCCARFEKGDENFVK